MSILLVIFIDYISLSCNQHSYYQLYLYYSLFYLFF